MLEGFTSVAGDTIRRVRAIVPLLALVGCGASHRPAAPSAPGQRVSLRLPRAFVARRSFQLGLTPEGGATRDARIRLLRSAGVPDEFQVAFTLPRVCGEPSGALTLQRVDAPAGAAVTAELRESAVVVRTRAAGTAELHVYGEYVHGATTCGHGLPEGSRAPAHATLRVEVSDEPGRPRIGGLDRCGDATEAPFAATRSEPTLRLDLLDAANQPLSFSNLSPVAPFEVTVESDVPVAVAHPGALQLAQRPGRVRFASADGRDAWAWRWFVPPTDVTDVAVRFYVPGAAGTPVDVTEGASIGGGNRRLRGVFFELRAGMVGAQRLCDAPDARWFRLYSDTPEVCRVVAVDSRTCDGCSGPGFGHEAAFLVRDGVCSLRAEAAELNGRRGVRRRVSAEFVNVGNFSAAEFGTPAPSGPEPARPPR